MSEWKYANYPTHNGLYKYSREHSYILPRLCKIDVRGREIVTKIGQSFIAAFYPHRSHFDSYTTYHELLNLGITNIIVAAAADHWFEKFHIRVLGNSIMPMFPQPRPEKGAAAYSAGKALLHLAQRVKEGVNLIWAPEGTRDGNGKLNMGIAALAQRSERPVVPVVLHGLENSWPKVKPLPNIKAMIGKKITICFCPPISWSEYPNNQLFLDRLKQTYVQTYAELIQNYQGF